MKIPSKANLNTLERQGVQICAHPGYSGHSMYFFVSTLSQPVSTLSQLVSSRLCIIISSPYIIIACISLYLHYHSMYFILSFMKLFMKNYVVSISFQLYEYNTFIESCCCCTLDFLCMPSDIFIPKILSLCLVR